MYRAMARRFWGITGAILNDEIPRGNSLLIKTCELSAQLESFWTSALVHPTYKAESYFGYITGGVRINSGAYLGLANLEYNLSKPE
jgi:hypothetical protein